MVYNPILDAAQPEWSKKLDKSGSEDSMAQITTHSDDLKNSEGDVFNTIGGVDSRDVASDDVPDSNDELISIEDSFGSTAKEIDSMNADSGANQKIQDLVNPLPSLPDVDIPDFNMGGNNSGNNQYGGLFNKAKNEMLDAANPWSGITKPVEKLAGLRGNNSGNKSIIDKLFSLKGVAFTGILVYAYTKATGGKK